MIKKIISGSLFAILAVANIKAQNASYDLNSIPIYGTTNCGFGWMTLNNNSSHTGPYNVATGHSALFNNTSGENNVANGAHALSNNFVGNVNVALGYESLFNNNADENTATGHSALFTNFSGGRNTADGYQALFGNYAGIGNTATGYQAMATADADYNTAVGHQAMFANSAGNLNVAIGKSAMYYVIGNTNIALGYTALRGGPVCVASDNVGIGVGSLYNLTYGTNNIAVGINASFYNTTGSFNVAHGYEALRENYSGSDNIAFGINALLENTTGSNHIALGSAALYNYNGGALYPGNVAVGCVAGHWTSTRYTTAVGYYALVTTLPASSSYEGNSVFGRSAEIGSTYGNGTAIGKGAIVNANNKIRLGDANVTTVETEVAINVVSDGRFKYNISEDDIKGLAFIEKLKPVVYNFDTKKFTALLCKNMPDSIKKMHMDNDFTKSTAMRQSGFIAQEVEKAALDANFVFSGISKPTHEDDNYGLSYDMFVVPLVKAVQEQQSMLEEQKKINESLQKEVNERRQLLNAIQGQAGIELEQLYTPEPGFNMTLEPATQGQNMLIHYNLPGTITTAYLAVYDLTGKEISQLSCSNQQHGSILIPVDQLNAGIYIYSFIADNKILGSGKMAISQK